VEALKIVFNFCFELLVRKIFYSVSYFETTIAFSYLFLRDETEILLGVAPTTSKRSPGEAHEWRSAKKSFLCRRVDSQAWALNPGRTHCGLGSNFEGEASRFCFLFRYNKQRIIGKCLDVSFLYRIWAYLIQITQEEDITVLITTHYIEETKNANKVSLIFIKLVLIIYIKKLIENIL